MKKIVLYECEICHSRHENEEYIKQCEAKGRPIPRPDLVGVIFGDNRLGAFYEEIVFAIPEIYGYAESLPVASSPHYLDSHLWACRNNGCGDSIGDEYCGGSNFFKYDNLENHIDTSLPAFDRMVKFLRKRGLTPKIIMPDGTIEVWKGE